MSKEQIQFLNETLLAILCELKKHSAYLYSVDQQLVTGNDSFTDEEWEEREEVMSRITSTPNPTLPEQSPKG